MAVDLNLSDNREKLYINKELYGEDRVIIFSLSDVNIFTRADEAGKRIQEYFDAHKEAEPSDNDAAIAFIREADAFIKEQINYIFDYDASAAIFGNTSALSQVAGGKMYFEVFLDAVMPHIEQALKAAGNTMQQRTAKYTQKYKK